MTARMKEALRRSLAGLALGGFIAFTSVPAAMAQWLRPWPAVSPGDIEQRLEAQGYLLDCAAPSPTDGVPRRRERRPGGLSAPGDRRLERRHPSALRCAPATLGTRIRHARGGIRRAPAARRRWSRRQAADSRPCLTRTRRRNPLTADRQTYIFRPPLARSGPRTRRPQRSPSRSPTRLPTTGSRGRRPPRLPPPPCRPRRHARRPRPTRRPRERPRRRQTRNQTGRRPNPRRPRFRTPCRRRRMRQSKRASPHPLNSSRRRRRPSLSLRRRSGRARRRNPRHRRKGQAQSLPLRIHRPRRARNRR